MYGGKKLEKLENDEEPHIYFLLFAFEIGKFLNTFYNHVLISF